MSSLEARTFRKLFEKVQIKLSTGLELTFDIFDQPIAQKWASLLSCYIPLRENHTFLKLNPPNLELKQSALEKSLFLIQHDESYIALSRNFSYESGCFTLHSIHEIEAYVAARKANAENFSNNFQLSLLNKVSDVITEFKQCIRQKRNTGVTVKFSSQSNINLKLPIELVKIGTLIFCGLNPPWIF